VEMSEAFRVVGIRAKVRDGEDAPRQTREVPGGLASRALREQMTPARFFIAVSIFK